MPLRLNKPALRVLGIAESFARPGLLEPDSPGTRKAAINPASTLFSITGPSKSNSKSISKSSNPPVTHTSDARLTNRSLTNRSYADSRSMLAGVVMRGDRRVDGLAYSRATVGGDDATEAVLELYRKIDRQDINALVLGGAVVSWFNIIDLKAIYEEVNRPLISLSYEESHGLERYLREYFPQSKEKLERYRALGRREKVCLKTGYELFVRVHGATTEEARILLNRFTLDGRVPEPVRLARMAARAARRFEEGLASGV